MKHPKFILASLVILLSIVIGIVHQQYQQVKLPAPQKNKSAAVLEDRIISTEEYIEQFDPRRYELAGSDYFNPRYSLSRLNKPIDLIDNVYDYPFDYLDGVMERLANVDRRQALKAIFEKVTKGTTTNLERHLAVLKFLQKSSFHNYLQPMHRDRQAVFDPLVLLEVGEMRCGAVARLGVDLFEAAGYKGRIVQAAEHVSAEIYYDDGWHLFEADLSGGPPVIIDGKIPSIQQLALTPYVIDKLPSTFERMVGPVYGHVSPAKYASYYYFSKDAVGSIQDAYYYKTASASEASTSKWYGLNYYRAETNRWPLTRMKAQHQPDVPVYKSVQIFDRKVVIGWYPSNDVDGDLLGYKVYVSSYSRGWNYRDKDLSRDVGKYVLNSWKPDMYDNMYKEPPSDIGLFETTKNSIELSIPEDSTIYVTVMAFDRHGESVGVRLYNMSPELAIKSQ